jgi:endo-1,3(4)-beta-glucanase
MTMRALILLAAVLVGGGTAVASVGIRSTRTSLPAPAMADRSSLPKRQEEKNAPKPPLKPFPTNAWWSGGSLETWPSPLYAWPLVVDLSADGVKIDAPGTRVEGNAFFAAENAPLRVRFDAPADKATVSSFGDWDVTFDLSRGRSRVARVTAVQGSPYAWIESDELTLHVDLPAGSAVENVPCSDPCTNARLVSTGDTRYLVATAGSFAQSEGRLTVTLPLSGKKIVSFAVIAPGADVRPFVKYAMTVTKGTKVSWKETRTGIETRFTYPSVTLMGILPHHADSLKYVPKIVGTYETLRGPVSLVEAASFTTTNFSPRIEKDPGLHPTLTKDATFLETLRSEVGSQNPSVGDSYAAGKQLLRSALLARLAAGTADAELKTSAIGKAGEGLAAWCGGKYSYDARLGGVIGEPTSFGSEHYNDHHFHYGYVIHAAAIVAELDPSWEKRYGDCIDVLVRDIAADRGDASFPFLRYMDAYAGHSWANGLTRFADGQNQESVSEALQAWHAIALWGDVTRQKDLSTRGRWLVSQELSGAKTYWFNAGKTKTFPEGFAKPMVSILWGGKADFATFFDGSDAAIHGIQFFPAVPAVALLLEGGVGRDLVAPLARAAQPTIWTNHLRIVAPLAKERAPDPGRPLDAFYSESYVRNWLATY